MSLAMKKTTGSPSRRTDGRTTMAADRDKALDTALANIERQFGKGSVMRLGEETRAALEVIPTGAISLDVALGIGGLPRGRVVEIYGPESSGKTTVALHAVANAQAGGGIVAFIDAEHALDPDYAKALGVDTDALLVSQPDSGEQALEIADMLIRSGALDLIVIDSVAALVPRAEIEGEMGDSHVGLQARLMSQALRKMTGALNNAGTTMIFINQLREKIGVMFGSPETTSGGRALKFYSSVRLDVRRIETLKDGQEMVGNRTRIKVVKNKVAPPFKQAEFDIMYGQGISREGGLIDVGVDAGLVRKAGAWYTYEGDQLGQGKENSRAFLRDNPDLANEIEKRILEKLGVGPQVDAAPERRRSGRFGPRADRDRLLNIPSDDADPGPEADPESVARKILLDQLTGRARSRSELRAALAKKHVPDEIAERLLDRFEEVGLVNDEAFARAWVESRQPGKGLARRALAQELHRKGVADETAALALDEIDHDDEVEAARTLVRRKLRTVGAARARRRHATAHRHARPQGLLVRRLLPDRPRRARGARSRHRRPVRRGRIDRCPAATASAWSSSAVAATARSSSHCVAPWSQELRC